MAHPNKDFVVGQSDNLPKLDLFMVMQYISKSDCYNSAEMKGVKAIRAMRQDYIKSAVGYVQLQRRGQFCIVKCQICPEHKIKSKNYSVTMKIDEVEEEIVCVICHDCPAAEGGCKHALAFLTWVYEKSNEPSTTDVECYWKKPKLSISSNDTKFITTKDFGSALSFNIPGASNFLVDFIEAKGQRQVSNCHLLKYFAETNSNVKLSLHHIILDVTNTPNSGITFLNYAATIMDDVLCQKAEKATRLQHKSTLWHELRFGRITASKIYEAAHCNLTEGVLVQQIVGAKKIKPTFAMHRGQLLEDEVLKVIQKNLKNQFKKVGLLLSSDYPELGASPDALGEDCVIEIKCPMSNKTFNNYLNGNQIRPRYKAQIQLQMLFFKKQKGLFCVADPNFESNRKVSIIVELFDQNYITDLTQKARCLWLKSIYPILYSIK